MPVQSFRRAVCGIRVHSGVSISSDGSAHSGVSVGSGRSAQSGVSVSNGGKFPEDLERVKEKKSVHCFLLVLVIV